MITNMITNMTTNNTNNGAKKSDWNNVEVGALWKRESKKSGEKYLSGTLKFPEGVTAGSEVQLIIFTNKSKKSEGQPDLRVYLSENRKNSNNTQAAPQKSIVVATPTVKQVVQAPQVEEELI